MTDFCIDDAEYWYARLVLHQALALYTIAGSNPRGGLHLSSACRCTAEGSLTPSSREVPALPGARCGGMAIGSGRWRSLLWVDEGVAVSRRPTELSSAAAQLVADVTLLLNLRERAPEDRQADFPHMRELPHCLGTPGSRDRKIRAGCPRSCGYGLCPLTQPPPDEPNGQRTVSRSFCRGMYEIRRQAALAEAHPQGEAPRLLAPDGAPREDLQPPLEFPGRRMPGRTISLCGPCETPRS